MLLCSFHSYHTYNHCCRRCDRKIKSKSGNYMAGSGEVRPALLAGIREGIAARGSRRQSVKIFYSSHILPHISFSSTVWDGCGETHLIKLNSLHRRAAKLLLPDKNSSTDEKNESPEHTTVTETSVL